MSKGSDSQKHESSCLLSNCFSCVSPEPIELQKSYLHLFASSSEELSDEIGIIQIRSQNQLIFAKNVVLTEKSKLLEKIRHFEKFKIFFSWNKCLWTEPTYKPFSSSKIVTQPLQVKLDVFAVFL